METIVILYSNLIGYFKKRNSYYCDFFAYLRNKDRVMEKTRLIQLRKKKNISQQQMAEELCLDVSNYNRREKGICHINSEEWQKLSKILDCPVEDIYQPDESQYIVCKDQSVGINNGTNNVYTIPQHILDSQRKYIALLEKKIDELENLTSK